MRNRKIHSGIVQQKVLLDHYRACGQEANDSSAMLIRETINPRVILILLSDASDGHY
jgi:hypothetical protein